MSVINDTWRFLVQRKLWPVAILLIAAAVAVPKLLTKEPPAPAAAPVVAVKGDKRAVLATEPIVAQATDGDRSGRRQVLGSRKDPFKPQATPTPIPTPDVEKPATTEPTPSTEAPSVGGSPAPAAGTPVLPTVPAKPKKTYELNELTVRFGPSDDAAQPPRKDVKRLQALPDSDLPVLIYLGVLDDKQTAVFLLDSGVLAQGDGTCMPSRTTCETIHIKEGETEFFDVVTEGEDGAEGEGAQYQLDVVAIRKKTTTNAKKAKRAMARVSKSGRKIVRARVTGDGPLRYRYDAKSGRLEKLSKKAYKAVVSKAAKAARAHF
jgi:hypothetical protein